MMIMAPARPSSAAPSRPDVAARREAILDAALACFARYGLRRTSMEDIAREAGVSRAAVYHHFGGKEALFVGLVERLHEASRAEAEEAARRPGPVGRRVLGVLEAKVVRFASLLAGSEHGEELLDGNHRLCGDIAAAAAARHRGLLARVLDEAARAGELDLARAGLGPEDAASLLLDAADGLKGRIADGTDPDTLRRRLGQLVDVLLRGLRAGDA
jgi:AcrR family transcriptional regulator